MRLICPRCGAQYEIDGAAIPPAGRDVQCSACDHVWRAFPAADPFDPLARPQLSRPLSDSVIEILREEAARELEVRAAERRALRAAERAAAMLDEPPSDPGQGSERRSAQVPDPDAALADGPGAAENAGRIRDDAAGAVPRPLDIPVPPRAGPMREDAPPASGGRDTPGAADSVPTALPRQPARPPVAAAPFRPASPVPRGVRRNPAWRRRHDAGFRLAVIVALVAVALYALAPRLSGVGPLGATLAEWRSGVDRGRGWLAVQGEAATDRLRGAWGN